MNARLKILRKALQLTQGEFGHRLGVQNTAISKIENGENSLTDQMILAICREFGVNETWLRIGSGEMIIESDDAILTALTEEFKLDILDQKIVEAFIKLPAVERKAVKKLFAQIAYSIEKGEVEGVIEYFASYPSQMKKTTLPRSLVLPPNLNDINGNSELTEEEAIALVRAQFAAAKKGEEPPSK